MFLFNFGWNCHAGSVDVFGEHSCKAMSDSQEKIITESSGAVIKSLWGRMRCPKQASSLLCWSPSALLRETETEWFWTQLPKLRFKCLPLATTWIYRREEWGWTRTEVGGVIWESSSRCVSLSLACMTRSVWLLSRAFLAEGWIPGTLPVWAFPYSLVCKLEKEVFFFKFSSHYVAPCWRLSRGNW